MGEKWLEESFAAHLGAVAEAGEDYPWGDHSGVTRVTRLVGGDVGVCGSGCEREYAD